MSKSRNLINDKPLTREQVLLAAINSEHPTVKEAIEKLTFVVEMSHSRDELAKLVDPFVRQIQAVFENDGEYKRYKFRWCGDEFEVLNQRGMKITGGDSSPNSSHEPILVYVLDRD